MPSKRGEVYLVDLGYLGKIRPCVAVSIPNADRERNMTVFAPLTTEIRGGQCEVAFSKPRWLNQTCVVLLIAIAGIDNAKVGPFLGSLDEQTMQKVDAGLKRMLAV